MVWLEMSFFCEDYAQDTVREPEIPFEMTSQVLLF